MTRWKMRDPTTGWAAVGFAPTKRTASHRGLDFGQNVLGVCRGSDAGTYRPRLRAAE
jgi:hypothetical protein